MLTYTLTLIAAVTLAGPSPSAYADPPEPVELLAAAERADPGEAQEPCGSGGWVGDGEDGRDAPGCDADADPDAASLGGRAGLGGLDEDEREDGPEPWRDP